MLQAHYRSVLDLSNDALLAAEKGFNKLMDAINILEGLKDFSDNSDFNTKEWVNNCYKAMNDDFNTPILIANIFDAVKFINKVNQQKANISKEDWEVLIQIFAEAEMCREYLFRRNRENAIGRFSI